MIKVSELNIITIMEQLHVILMFYTLNSKQTGNVYKLLLS
jgi:hypothetical protein